MEGMSGPGWGRDCIILRSTPIAVKRILQIWKTRGYPAIQQGEWKEEPKNGRYAYLDMQDSLKMHYRTGRTCGRIKILNDIFQKESGQKERRYTE